MFLSQRDWTVAILGLQMVLERGVILPAWKLANIGRGGR